EVLPISRGYYQTYRNVAEAALDSKSRLDEAVAFFQREEATHPERAEAHHLLGELHLRRGAFEEAIQAFQKALSTDPGRKGSKLRLGDAFRAGGDFEGALAAYREVLQGIPEPSFSLWASLAAASRNAMEDAPLKQFWDDLKKNQREDSP